jgi:hypothetical protein
MLDAATNAAQPAIFFTRPISLGLLIAAALLLVMVFLPAIRKKREEAFVEEEEFQEFPHLGGWRGSIPSRRQWRAEWPNEQTLCCKNSLRQYRTTDGSYT